MSEPQSAGAPALGAPQVGASAGVFPSQALNQAIEREWVSSGDYRIRPEAIQPASIDLRLGDFAWALRCSFLPDVDSTVEEKVEGLAFQKIDLRDGAVLERDRPYLVPLIEELALPEDVRAKANPKSSTGRLDVFTRVITDRHHRFDDVRAGYRGKLYLEVVPRSFAIQVKTGLSLNQLRLARGEVRLGDGQIRELQDESPLLYLGSEALGRSPTASSSVLTSPGRAIARSATGRRRTASRSTCRAFAPTAGTTTGTPSFPSPAAGSSWSRRSSTCCSLPRASASHPRSPPR
jgi:deoxycytidine triphosphate deaminase